MSDELKNMVSSESRFMESESEQNKSIPNTEQLIYCGPNVPKRGVFCYQVFIGGLPFNVRELIAEIPEAEKLIVPVNELEQTRRRISVKGTVEHLYYERIEGKVK